MGIKNLKTTSENYLQRIFTLIPLIYNNQGLTLDDLLLKSGFQNRRELEIAINRLMMFGVAPFSPSDFISVHIDNKDRVWLENPMGLERPLSLTSQEWTLLQKIIQKEMEVLSQANCNTGYLQNLLSLVAGVPIQIENDEQTKLVQSIIQEALADNLQVSFLYQSLSSKEPELRRVDPWYIFRIKTTIYLIAYCHTRCEARSFVLDRIKNLEILELEQEEHPPRELQKLFKKSVLFQTQKKEAGFTIHLAFDASLLNSLKRTFTLKKITLYKKPNWLQAQTKVQDSIWLQNILQSYGTQIILVSPKHIRESFIQNIENYPLPKILQKP